MLCAEGRVALLGDSAHAMQPNLGQGGCMAIEDGYQLGKDLAEKAEEARATGRALDAPKVLQVLAWPCLCCLLVLACRLCEHQLCPANLVPSPAHMPSHPES